MESINGLIVGKRYFFEEINASGVFQSFNGHEYNFGKVLPEGTINKKFIFFPFNPLVELRVKIIE